jgi:hypothetical protein
MVDQRGLPDTGPGNDCNDIDMLVCPCIIEESDILLSPKNIASSNGNLATEIFSGPSLFGGWRVVSSPSSFFTRSDSVLRCFCKGGALASSH